MIVQVPSNEFTKRMSAENNNSYEINYVEGETLDEDELNSSDEE